MPIRKEAKSRREFCMNREYEGQRIEIQKRAKFTLKDEKRGWEACTLLNLNQNLQGVGVCFHTTQDIGVNSIVIIDLSDEDGDESLSIVGIVRWIKKGEVDLTGGLELIGNINKLERILPVVPLR
jgi:hypothetical protein